MHRAWLLAVLASCGSSDSAKTCTDTQVEVDYFRGTRAGEMVCKPIPMSCGAVASCGDTNCIRDMYGLCDSPYIGAGCSDTFPPTIISCNP
jgi:hypothetical protein